MAGHDDDPRSVQSCAMVEIELIETPTPQRDRAPRRLGVLPLQEKRPIGYAATSPLWLGRNGPFGITDPLVHRMHAQVLLEREDHPAQVKGTEGPVAVLLNGTRVYLAWLLDGDE